MLLRAFFALLVLIASPAVAQDGKRFALLIGNADYSAAIGALKNPRNDVALLERTLSGLGFSVTTVRDAGLAATMVAINGHVRRLRASGSGAIGLFYYSGHGASDGALNYLIPVDASTVETAELWDQSLQLNAITTKLKTEAGEATHFVIFDACRNTLRLREPGKNAIVQAKGFVPIQQEAGLLISYATAEGALASDMGENAGPYATALAAEIVKPGVEAVSMFRNVQRRVRASIGQEPYLGYTAMGDVFFAGGSETVYDVFLDVPLLKHEPNWAGEAAIQMIMKFHGRDVSQEAINAAANLKGIRPDIRSSDIPVALRGLGFQSVMRQDFGGYSEFLAFVKKSLDTRLPVITGLKRHPTSHPEWWADTFAVIVGYKGDTLILNTTSGEHIELPPDRALGNTEGLSFWNSQGVFFAVVAAPRGHRF